MVRRVLAILAAMIYTVLLDLECGAASNPVAITQLRCQRFATDALKPAPQTDREALERFESIEREVRAGPHAVLFLGDSITQKWDRALWDEHFAPRDALNGGVNGDRTEHLLWRIQNGNVDGQHPELVVLLIGTNDIGRDRPANVIAEGIRQILVQLRSRLPSARVLLLGVLPRSESPSSHRRQQVHDVNQLIRTCADDHHVFYADAAASLLDREGRFTWRVSIDGVHLTAQGYAQLADRLDQEFDRVLPNQ